MSNFYCVKAISHRLFSDTVISVTSKTRKRNKDDLVLLEGVRLIKDAHAAGAHIKAIYFSDEHNLEDYPELATLASDTVPIVKVARDDYKLVSKQVTPSGFMAVCKKPSEEHLKKIQESPLLPLSVIVDSFSDPGNLGTLV